MNEMKKILSFCAISFLSLGSAVYAGGQAAPVTPAQGGGDGARPARQRLVGEVTAVDAATHQVTVRADSGETVTVGVGDQTTYLRMPPGETKLEKGERATLADVRVGDRVLAPGVSAAGGQARQLILMARAGGPGQGGGAGRDDGRRLAGRVVSVDAAKRLVVVQTRGREGVEAVTIDASGDVRFLRFAPDSTRPADALPGSFADVKAGDTLRATGERAGAGFKAVEVLSGAFTRFTGTVTAVDAARGALTVKNEQTGQTVTLALGARSMLRRVTPEFEQTVAQQRAERAKRQEQRRAAGDGGQSPQGAGENRAGREGRREGEGARADGAGERQAGNGERRGQGGGGRRGGGGGGGNFQQMFESLPAVTPADLKKGDAVVVTGTPGADASRVTVISLVTGTADFLRSMQQFQRGDGPRGMSPGLPGDVIGGGQGGTREPPQR
jgi:hypothetical protein